MTIETSGLKQWLKSRWSWLGPGKVHRKTIVALCDAVETLSASDEKILKQKQSLQEEVTEQKHQIALLKSELTLTREQLSETQIDLQKARDKYEVLLVAKEPAEIQETKDELHRTRVELDLLKHKLAQEGKTTKQLQSQVQRLWNFIAIRHRIHEAGEVGTILKSLQESERL